MRAEGIREKAVYIIRGNERYYFHSFKLYLYSVDEFRFYEKHLWIPALTSLHAPSMRYLEIISSLNEPLILRGKLLVGECIIICVVL